FRRQPALSARSGRFDAAGSGFRGQAAVRSVSFRLAVSISPRTTARCFGALSHPNQGEIVTQKAILVLEDGSVFRGHSIGAHGSSVGEVVFNTAMTGYQEILTDPSYARQIVTLTFPQVGNTGCNPADAESGRVHAAGLVIRDLSKTASNWRSEESLPDYLVDRKSTRLNSSHVK